MNIFMLHKDPKLAAKHHYNKHVVKMILESAQLLSTAHRVLDGNHEIHNGVCNRKKSYYRLSDEREEILYKANHINHPSAIWVRQSSSNYFWLFELYSALIKEYNFRYPNMKKGKEIVSKKIHGSSVLKDVLSIPPANIPFANNVVFPTKSLQAMPEYYKHNDAIQAYRNYYIGEKNLTEYYRKEFVYENGIIVEKQISLELPPFIQEHFLSKAS